MTDYAPIRSALVTGFRNSDKPAKVKNAAEVLIATIDGIAAAHGENDDNKRAFQENYARFVAAAEGQPSPEMKSVAEIAESFGLVRRHQ